jgi:hypothetical protein
MATVGQRDSLFKQNEASRASDRGWGQVTSRSRLVGGRLGSRQLTSVDDTPTPGACQRLPLFLVARWMALPAKRCNTGGAPTFPFRPSDLNVLIQPPFGVEAA